MTRPSLVDMVAEHPHLPALTRLIRGAFNGAGVPHGDRPGANRVTSMILFAAQGELGKALADAETPLDLLVLTDHHEFDDTYLFQDTAERRLRAAAHRHAFRLPPLHVSVHALADANRQLQSGSRLIARVLMDGVILDERPGTTFSLPPELTPAQVACEAAAQNSACRDVAAHFLARA